MLSCASHRLLSSAASPFRSSYYEECLRLAQVSDGDQPVVFVGDDLGGVEHEFGGDPVFALERNDEIVDLQLLVNAAVVVTSNSSFGWWGSWLGDSRPRCLCA